MIVRWQFVFFLLFTVGCGRGPGALRAPKVDAPEAAAAAVAEFDKDGDGKLAKAEWEKSGALAAVSTAYDSNKDGTLDLDELQTGFSNWQDNAVGPRPAPFTLKLDGQPLAGASVRLVPPAFLGDVFPVASAESNGSGGGHLDMSEADRPKNAPKIPLVQPGLYNVEVTHPSKKIPARYNTQTTLGIEITSSIPGPEGIVWTLSSK